MNKDLREETTENPNTIWANIFVDELARGGLRDVCIAPGSRSTPLALAFFRNPRLRVHVHLDERSAGFFALGIALAEERPAALLCTSGTAGANLFPAIIEANMSQVPLLIMTADRPHELRHSGANQTIDQVKMFGDHVLWAVDVALPEENAPQVALRNLRTLAARSLAAATGFRKGPVHLNFPFRKPLEPFSAEAQVNHDWSERERLGGRRAPFTTVEHGVIQPLPAQLESLAQNITRMDAGLIICGPQCPKGEFPQAVVDLAALLGYPILADATSGVRFGPHFADSTICGGYESFLIPPHSLPAPELILYFGAIPISGRLNDFLSKSRSALHAHIRESGVWSDDNHLTTHFLQVDALEFCRLLAKKIGPRRENRWLAQWLSAESRCWTTIAQSTTGLEYDGAFVADLFNFLPDSGTLFAGNSLPVRHIDQFAQPTTKALGVFANRGASGIDGNVSTGLGLAAAGRSPLTLLVGDITFYHDSNGLLAIRNLATADVTIVVLNNNGGGIFRRLPISQYDPPYSELFRVPHGLELGPFAKIYGLDYVRVRNREAMRNALSKRTVQARLIEITTDAESDHQLHREVESRIRANLDTDWGVRKPEKDQGAK